MVEGGFFSPVSGSNSDSGTKLAGLNSLNPGLIIIKDPYSTIVLDKNDVDDIIVFLEQ